MRGQSVRRVTKRVYDAYSAKDYEMFSDSLNPVNPTQLESQFNDILSAVQVKIESAYAKAKLPVPDDLISLESPTVDDLQKAFDNLVNALQEDSNPLVELINTGVDPSQLMSGNSLLTSIFDNPLTLDCEGVESNGKASEYTISYEALIQVDENVYDIIDSNGNSYPFNGTSSWYFFKDDASNPLVLFEDQPEVIASTVASLDLGVPLVNEDYEFDGWYFTVNPTQLYEDKSSSKKRLYIASTDGTTEIDCYQFPEMDEDSNEPFEDDTLPNQGKSVTVYAKIVKKGYATSRGDSSDSSQSSNSGNDSSGNGSSENKTQTEFNITYKVPYMKSGATLPDACISTYSSHTFENGGAISLPTLSSELENDYVFKGWYWDSGYNNKVKDNKITINRKKDITIYAYVTGKGEEDESGSNQPVKSPGGDAVTDDDEGCTPAELSFLRIILIVLKIAKIFIQVMVLVYNIMKASADIAKDAQLCWINPPSMQSLIAYVMQRLSGIIFQLLGMLLLYLWQLLNLDCISADSSAVLDQINSVMAGISSSLKKFEVLACQMSSGDLRQSFKDAADNLKEQIRQALQDAQDTLNPKRIRNEVEKGIETYVKGPVRKFKENPWLLYDAAVPDDIKDAIDGLIDAGNLTVQQAKDVKKSTTSAIQAVQKLLSKNNETDQGANDKNVEIDVIL